MKCSQETEIVNRLKDTMPTNQKKKKKPISFNNTNILPLDFWWVGVRAEVSNKKRIIGIFYIDP